MAEGAGIAREQAQVSAASGRYSTRGVRALARRWPGLRRAPPERTRAQAPPGGACWLSPMRTATTNERNDLTRRALRVAAASGYAGRFCARELHLWLPKAPWATALEALARVGPRVALILPDTVCDIGGQPPMGRVPAGFAHMPLDNLLVDEAVTLRDAGWKLIEVTRVHPVSAALAARLAALPPDDPASPALAHEARAQVVAAHAGKACWTYFRSTRVGFVFPKGVSL